ncbi:hypothetical protein R3P38DRAFT_3197616 [Favolaschia claudopus]|uniref:Uncharacterized protein n=1 Tax=Favolaschia claudopus TaxID=2862362 RepID=A0AAW0B3I5_9AGAR
MRPVRMPSSKWGSSSFEDIHEAAKALWNEKLSKIEIDIPNTPENVTLMLSSSLYRAAPHSDSLATNNATGETQGLFAGTSSFYFDSFPFNRSTTQFALLPFTPKYTIHNSYFGTSTTIITVGFDGKLVQKVTPAGTKAYVANARQNVTIELTRQRRTKANKCLGAQSIPDTQDFIRKEGKGASAQLPTHCQRELFHESCKLMLDDEFIHAYKDGIVLPRCKITKENIPNLLGHQKVSETRKLIYQGGYVVNSTKVEELLMPESLVPTEVSFIQKVTSQIADTGLHRYFSNSLHGLDFDTFDALVVDFMHDEGVDTVHEFNARFRQVAPLGRSTIRRLPHSVPELKKLGARSYKDILQCLHRRPSTGTPQHINIRSLVHLHLLAFTGQASYAHGHLEIDSESAARSFRLWTLKPSHTCGFEQHCDCTLAFIRVGIGLPPVLTMSYVVRRVRRPLDIDENLNEDDKNDAVVRISRHEDQDQGNERQSAGDTGCKGALSMQNNVPRAGLEFDLPPWFMDPGFKVLTNFVSLFSSQVTALKLVKI